MPATSAADKQTQFALHRLQTALEGTDDAGGDAGGVPVHPHNGAERLEPERIRQTSKQFVASIFLDDRLADHPAQLGHTLGQPGRYASVMQGQVGTSGSLSHRL